MRRALVLFLTLFAWLTGPVSLAQAQGLGLTPGISFQSDILVIEFEQVFSRSQLGQQILSLVEEEALDLDAQNSQIEKALEQEEEALTEIRSTLSATEFRNLADAFDTKVQRLRNEQDAKALALNQRTEEARRAFLTAAQPVLSRIMQEAGALVILERRAVFVVAEVVDVTELAISRLDDAVADGGLRLTTLTGTGSEVISGSDGQDDTAQPGPDASEDSAD